MINFVLIFRFLAHARIRICVAFVLHDMGNDDEAMREADEADKMLRDGECFEDFVEIHNVKANIILSRSKNSTEHRKLVLSHLERSLYFCGKVSVDKSVTIRYKRQCVKIWRWCRRDCFEPYFISTNREIVREKQNLLQLLSGIACLQERWLWESKEIGTKSKTKMWATVST